MVTIFTYYIHYSIQLLTGFEGNRWSVGPEDELLPEAEGRGQQFIWGANRSSVARKPRQQLFCYTPFSWIMFNDERTGTRQNDPFTQHKTLYIFFFLPLMNHFSRQNTYAIVKKSLIFSSSSHTAGTVSKSFSNRCIFSSRPRTFFFRRSSNDYSIASRHSFGIFYAVLTSFYVFLLSLPSRIIFMSSSEALATLCSASATTDAICKRSNVKRR